MILVNQKIKYRAVDVQDDCNGKIEACAVEIFSKGESIFLVSCYRPPNIGNVSSREWFSFINQFGNRVLFGGDFNVHNELWGSTHTCSSGAQLWEGLFDSDFVLLNNGSPTFHSASHRSNSVIVLSFTHCSMALDFDWKVTRSMG